MQAMLPAYIRNRARFATFLKVAPLIAGIAGLTLTACQKTPVSAVKPLPEKPLKPPSAKSIPSASPAYSGPVFQTLPTLPGTLQGAAPLGPISAGWTVPCKLSPASPKNGLVEAVTTADLKSGPVVLLPGGTKVKGVLLGESTSLAGSTEWTAYLGKPAGMQIRMLATAKPQAAGNPGDFSLLIGSMNTVQPSPPPAQGPVVKVPSAATPPAKRTVSR